jgi:TATA-binding protein-associated factor Taf7
MFQKEEDEEDEEDEDEEEEEDDDDDEFQEVRLHRLCIQEDIAHHCPKMKSHNFLALSHDTIPLKV